jgi:hypothetical protein
MYQTVTQHDFIRAFEAMGRAEQFTRSGLLALFEYLEDLEADLGESMELDVIALCCDWSEMTREDLEREYPDHFDADEETMLENFNDVSHMIRVDQGSRGEDTFLLLAF